MEKVDIYIKPAEKVQIIQKREVFLEDVAEVFSIKERDSVKKIIVFQVPSNRKKVYLLSVLDLIQAVYEVYPDASVFNEGEANILVEYLPEKKKEGKLWLYMKVLFVAAILFVGAATTIMCFHTDVQLPLIFQNIYYIFYGENREMPSLLSVPYSIGLGLGIIIFFNHFSKASITEDPTPIEIEMTTYEKETNASIVDFLGRRKGGGEK